MIEQSGQRFAGNVAVVTGGASGIGLATARRLVSEGARVVIGDRDAGKLADVQSELGDAVATVLANVTVEDDVERLTSTAIDRFGRLDISFANAGVGALGRIVDTTLAEWQGVLDVNLTGAFLTIKHAARRMVAGGSIVVTASLNAVQPGIGVAPYCAAKAGVAMLVQVAAMELGSAGIRVNAVAPGLVNTSLTAGVFAVPGIAAEFVENTPLMRPAEPEEIANVVAFLASEEAAFITGSLMLVDGGAHTMRYPDMISRLSEAFPSR